MSAQDPYAIRRAAPGEEPDRPSRPPVPDTVEPVDEAPDREDPDEVALPEGGVTGPVRWRVRAAIPVAKAVGAALFLGAGLVSLPDVAGVTVGAVCALVLGAWAVRDLVAGVRLAADRDGVTVVTGYAGHHRLAWDDIERLRVDRRSRLGVHSELVEIDAGEQIHLFSRNELSAPCGEVVAVLRELRRQGGQ